MLLREPVTIEPSDDAVGALPEGPAVLLIWARQGAPYLARTRVLRRRLTRLLADRAQPSRFLNLRAVAARVDYWLTGSSLEQSLIGYELAREHFPEDYPRRIKLRLPVYLKLILTNAFPRTQLTTRLGAGDNVYYGPFLNRTAAELFSSQFLDLFQIRRCEEDLMPTPEHPGCIYGEMNRCLRPCQEVVTLEEYSREAARVHDFLATRGASLAESVVESRDRLSAEMNFEEAARQHARYERVQEIVRLGGELARDVRRLAGVAVTRSAEPECVELWFVREGCWLPGRRLRLASDGQSVSLDHRLRQAAAAQPVPKLTARERQEHLALLVRWFHSSWRDGEWLGFDGPASIPYRRLVNAIQRVVTAAASDRPAASPAAAPRTRPEPAPPENRPPSC